MQAGKTLRGYELRRKLGEGGFGEVYLAYQPAVEREVAIKAIPASAANQPEFIRRFEFEARVIARLEHPHIVPLFDFWRDPDGAYLVMRYLRGGGLTRLIQQGPLSRESALRVVDQICAALHTAHRAGVIHRDIKPDNILLDEDGNAYLADFGIAKSGAETIDDTSASGTPAYMSPEQITGENLTPQSDLYALGFILYEIVTGTYPYEGVTVSKLIFKHIEDTLPDIIRADVPFNVNDVIHRATAKNPKERFATALELAQAFRVALLGESMFETIQLPEIDFSQVSNPYKGLRPFEEADADDFNGREMLIERLIARLSEDDPLANFLAVVGPSGSGKSSVVLAGLLPALRKGAVAGAETWFVAEMTPGAQPLKNLEEALLRVAMNPPVGLYERLSNDANGLTWGAQQVLAGTQDDLLLIVDQFEEVFTATADESERAQFLDLLRSAVTDPETRLRVIVTLRADFTDRPLHYVEFGELMRRRTEFVLPMTVDELERAISAPAQRLGLNVDANLIAQMVADVRQEPGALPLLQYALYEVFERRDGGFLTLGAYHEIGGVAGALAKRADEVFLLLRPEQQHAARQVFLRLVTLGEGAEDTRRRVKRSELAAALKEQKTLDSVLNTFGRHRLLSFDVDAQTREPTIEVAHEALIREWERLRQWLDSSRDAVRLQRLLATAAQEWQANGRDTGFLLSGSRLAQFVEWIKSTDLALTSDERAFFDASVRERDRREAEERERQERERALERRAARNLRAVALVLAAGVLIALGLMALAFNQSQIAQASEATAVAERDRADESARVAQSGQVALQGLLEQSNNHFDTGLLLSVGALEIADTRAARSSLLTGLQSVPQLVTMLYAHAGEEVRALAYRPDGQVFATADRSGRIILWDAVARTPLVAPLTGHNGRVWSLAFNGDGTRLVSAGNDGTLRLWDAQTGAALGTPLANLSDPIFAVAFAPDGLRFASGHGDNSVRVWDMVTGEQVALWEAHQDYVYALAFSPDGALLASGSGDNTILLWAMNAMSGTPLRTLSGHTNWVRALAFSPDSASLASGDMNGTLRLWDVAAGMERRQPLTDHGGVVWSVAYSPDGALLVSASADRSLILRDAATGRRVQTIAPLLGHADEVFSAAFSPDSQQVISGGKDGLVLVWRAAAQTPLSTLWRGHTDEVYSVAYTPDGTQALSGGQDARALLWEVASGQVVREWPFSSEVLSVAVSADGARYAFGLADGQVALWDAPTAQNGAALAGHSATVRSLAFSPDGTRLASASDDGTIRVWDTSTGALVGAPLVGHEGVVSSVVYSADGRLLASGSFDATVRLWDAETGAPRGTLAQHTQEVYSVAFSPDGRLLASGSRDTTLMVWEVATQQPAGLPLLGHSDWVTSLAFSGDGRSLVSGSADDTLILWDIASGQAIGQPLRGHTDFVWSVAFAPDGQHLLSASRDSTLRLWDVDVASWEARACTLANRTLTPDEWTRYFGALAYRDVCAPGA
ncbi:MAG: protein kinase [Chloroflexi bacterium]|nr:protein kinase [Chloroflexota bacterium]